MPLEIEWFLDEHDLGDLYVAYTGGRQPWTQAGTHIPKPLLDAGFDLRGYDRTRTGDWGTVAKFRREMIKLAAELLNLDAGALYPNWLEAELKRSREESLNLATTARFETLADDPAKALLKAFAAHEIQPGIETRSALEVACKVAVIHHYNRRELAQLTGAGPAWLAGRWKQSDVFVKTSPDGRYRMFVTERGEDGGQPPGEVYLVSNETQRVIKLEPPERGRGRVEEVAFSASSQQVYIARYFDLAVYNLDGELVGTETFSRFSKSPVAMLAGPFGGNRILGADSKGGLWLVTPDSGRDGSIQVYSEWSKDAVLAAQIEYGTPQGDQAALVFESGRVEVLTLDTDDAPRCTRILNSGGLFAGWRADAR